jgi:hypothetical protein
MALLPIALLNGALALVLSTVLAFLARPAFAPVPGSAFRHSCADVDLAEAA